ncbi:hypothetical protein GCM10025734_07890 [Kitasatospora paranensis]
MLPPCSGGVTPPFRHLSQGVEGVRDRGGSADIRPTAQRPDSPGRAGRTPAQPNRPGTANAPARPPARAYGPVDGAVDGGAPDRPLGQNDVVLIRKVTSDGARTADHPAVIATGGPAWLSRPERSTAVTAYQVPAAPAAAFAGR